MANIRLNGNQYETSIKTSRPWASGPLPTLMNKIFENRKISERFNRYQLNMYRPNEK